ncbi:hypothetical protein DICSQDRAFT_82948 [Dichomitus squalens LYAD-421 SS1]|uniref:uncharacterized protein n=1 Tax=Dichomitus squalens (strain LYAD-421) TaxID=732165 RepID=UPI0004415C24|nr:uncharacterized protein DICSQDRAFT_82948 [Dichomitus squalens LYAD-421 SS1]EJF63373.1 hypothetical protein DICSQDRAFT_82948 [Dichomitus squalens LYAD-421 SS1]
MAETSDHPLDDSLYDPDEEETKFMKAVTGIDGDRELKQHVISVQAKAFKRYQYPYIRIFEFMRLKMARLPAYPDLLRLGRERPDAVLLDMGCCFGNDVRKAALDGFPAQNIVACDLNKDFWSLGHEMFRSTPATFPAHFLEGDILDPAFLSPVAPLPTSSSPAQTRPSLSSLTSLNGLHGHVSAIFAGAFFHLFSYPQQHHIAQLLAGLLSPLPGSVLFGVQGGTTIQRLWTPGLDGWSMECHSPESWRELWEGVFAEAGAKVEVKARLRKEIGGDDFFGMWPGNTDPYHVLEWSVTRL